MCVCVCVCVCVRVKFSVFMGNKCTKVWVIKHIQILVNGDVLETCSLHVRELPTFTWMMETEQVFEMFFNQILYH